MDETETVSIATWCGKELRVITTGGSDSVRVDRGDLGESNHALHVTPYEAI